MDINGNMIDVTVQSESEAKQTIIEANHNVALSLNGK